MVIDGVEYRLQIASDVTRDGLGLECYRVTEQGEEFLFEFFRSDRDKTLALRPSAGEIPFALLAHLVGIVPQRLGGHEA